MKNNNEQTSKRNFQLKEYPDLFIYGLTGSGKTTVAEYLREYFGYRTFRNAGTIKQIICEKHGWSPEELEENKRENPEIRIEHHTESEYLGKQTTLNRCQLLASRRAFEFENIDDPEKQIVIQDVRDSEEAEIYLKNDFVGIFLTRVTNEFNANHWTDVNIFQTDAFNRLSKEFPEQLIIIDNPIADIKMLSDDFFQGLPDYVKVIRLGNNTPKDELLEVIDIIIDNH